MRHAGKVMLFALSLCLFERIVLGGTAALSQEFDSKPANGQKRFTIASCNLRKADLSDPNAIKTTAEMISSFDVVALQCLQSDKAETDMLCLVEELNRNGHQFGYLLSQNAEDFPYGYAFI
jgi:hypothetical protein